MPRHDVHAKAVALAGGAIAGTVVLVVAAVFLLLRQWSVPAGGSQPTPSPVPPPQLQSAPQPELAAYREEKRRQLEGVGWVDAKAGIAHIPIADAMQLLVQRSAAARPRGRR